MEAAPLTPDHSCQCCGAPPAGPAAADGLMLRSYRIPGGLEASIELHPKYCAFPGQCSCQGVGGKWVHPSFEWEGLKGVKCCALRSTASSQVSASADICCEGEAGQLFVVSPEVEWVGLGATRELEEA